LAAGVDRGRAHAYIDRLPAPRERGAPGPVAE